MNIVDATVSGGKATLANGAQLPLHSAVDVNAKIGIRPEHLFVDEDGPMKFHVALAEHLGANTLLHGKLEASGEAFTVSLPGVHRITSGGPAIGLSIAPENIHLFDAENGGRLA